MSSTDTDSGEGAAVPTAASSQRFRTLGSLHEFRLDSEDFSTYMERVSIYFAANNVPKNKQVPVFLNAVGGTTYGVLHSLLAPDSPMSKSMTEITAKLRDHYKPKPSLIAERCQFHKRNQNPGELLAAYIAELRWLAVRCSFPRDYLDDTLRDRFVSRLRSEAIQKLLLTEKYLTLQIALEKSQSLETAQKNTQAMKGQAPLPVGQVSEHSRHSYTGQSGQSQYSTTQGGGEIPRVTVAVVEGTPAVTADSVTLCAISVRRSGIWLKSAVVDAKMVQKSNKDSWAVLQSLPQLVQLNLIVKPVIPIYFVRFTPWALAGQSPIEWC